MSSFPSGENDGQMTLEPIVFIVDDDKEIRDLLCDLLESIDLEVVAYGTAQAFLDAYRPGRPGCAVLDVRMPGMSGLELQERLVSLSFDLPVIILTSYGHVQMAVDALKAGVFDFIEKPFDIEKLLDRIQRAINESLRTRNIQAERAEIMGHLEYLTPRERQVMDMVTAGEISKVIADRLGICVKTVEFHRANVMRKMEATTLAELIRKVRPGTET